MPITEQPSPCGAAMPRRSKQAMAGAACRPTRFVCVSDTHNSQVKLPSGDVLIHAGDLTNQGSYSELVRAVAWLENADFECKIVVAGNHDVTLDRAFYREHGTARFHNQTPQSPDACIALLTASPTITYLCHGAKTVYLKKPGGPQTRFTVFGSPYSPGSGNWAFSYMRMDCNLWSAVPADVDIVVTHTPPFAHCDWSSAKGMAQGCEQLGRVLSTVRPRLAVCGHVHEARGVERVQWEKADDVASIGTEHDGTVVHQWDDPGSGPRNKKLSLVNLTLDSGHQAPLDNDGSIARGLAGRGCHETCVVNCAITATNYPHIGGKKFNKPIVVDLELPAWED